MFLMTTADNLRHNFGEEGTNGSSSPFLLRNERGGIYLCFNINCSQYKPCKSEIRKAYYHMTNIEKLSSIASGGLIPQNGENGKLVGEEKTKVFFSEGFEGAIALFADFEIVFNNVKSGQMKIDDKEVEERVKKANSLSEYLGEGVYLCFDGAEIEKERNFENGCTGKVISPKELNVCVLKSDESEEIVFSRFEIIKYMMAKVTPEEIKYYGASYIGSPSFSAATERIRGKVKKYYAEHGAEIEKYKNYGVKFCYMTLKEFMEMKFDGEA